MGLQEPSSELFRWSAAFASKDGSARAAVPWLSAEEQCSIPELLEQLAVRGAWTIPHAITSFGDHLFRTYELLSRWAQSPLRCRAGLLHSCYGSHAHDRALFGIHERAQLRVWLGVECERLVLLFATLDLEMLFDELFRSGVIPDAGVPVRNWRTGEKRTLAPRDIADLLAIELANTLEQAHGGQRRPGLWMAHCFQLARLLASVDGQLLPCFAPGCVGIEDERAARDAYLRGVELFGCAPARAGGCLTEACARNPHVGEPWLVNAALEHAKGHVDVGSEFASRGLALLRRWGIAWDKRGSLEQWLRFGAQLE